jgi:predicted 2-oxoglutarate/Fe(II)-dependent dioxygenase YbiX
VSTSNLNLASYVKKYDNACSPILIKAINDIIFTAPMKDAGVVGDISIKKETRNAKLLNLNDNTIGDSVAKRIIYNDIARLIKKIESQYVNELGVRYNAKDYTMEFLRYDSETKGHFVWHTDAYADAPRQLTMLLGLNDSYTGGTLKVLNDNYSFKLKTNELICFPSNFMFPHTVEPVQTGVRKVGVFWTL